jgi:hypothetical protein
LKIFLALLSKINGARFGKAKRKGIVTVDPDIEVGPGTYNIESTVPQLQPWEESTRKETNFKLLIK